MGRRSGFTGGEVAAIVVVSLITVGIVAWFAVSYTGGVPPFP
jgi:hypothetical protein